MVDFTLLESIFMWVIVIRFSGVLLPLRNLHVKSSDSSDLNQHSYFMQPCNTRFVLTVLQVQFKAMPWNTLKKKKTQKTLHYNQEENCFNQVMPRCADIVKRCDGKIWK